MSSIGNRFKYLRKQLKMTQKEFSAAVGISQGTLSDIEKNNCYPATETLLSVFRYINISADWLLKGVGPGPNTTDEQLINDLLELETSEKAGEKSAQTDRAAHILEIAFHQYLTLHPEPTFKEWVEIFETAPKEIRPALLHTARAIVQNYPNKALSTSPNTAEDEQAAARSDIA